ncbi:UpxY family transcription antiterminator [Zunongwangia sp.]|uniref:UpxY family transcription antiterminator n=1 Tax=Zunongwangia sp. TaxID=1965325 RepID=UPI003AA81038
MKWYVIYTKPKAELKVTNTLEKLGVEVYCPTFEEIRQWSDRKKKITTPLFKSYVFVRLKEKERPIVFDVPGVVRYLFWLGKPAIVRNCEIEDLKQWLSRKDLTQIKATSFKVGDEVQLANTIDKNKLIIEEICRGKAKLILPKLGYKIEAKLCDIINI